MGVFLLVAVTTGLASVAFNYLAYRSLSEQEATLISWLRSWGLGSILVSSIGPIVTGAIAGLVAFLVTDRSISPILKITETVRQVANGSVKKRAALDADSEVRSLAVAVNGLAEKFQYVDEQRRSLLAEVTHELRRPLSNVQGYAEMVEQQIANFTAEIQDSASAMQRQVETLARQIDGLRILANADSGDLALNTAPEYLNEVIELATEGYQTRARERGVELHLDVPSSLPTVEVDKFRVYQVIGNLLDNAIGHMPSGGELRVSAKKEGRAAVRVVVEDTGTGIPADALPHIFERFFSGDPVQTSGRGGFGLGLTVASQIIEMHGGKIWVESRLGHGSKFYFTLPIIDKPALRLLPPQDEESIAEAR